VADDDQEDLIGSGLIGRGGLDRYVRRRLLRHRRRRGDSLMPQDAADEGDGQHRRRRESDLPMAKAPALAAELPAKPRPDLLRIALTALRDGHGVDEREDAAQRFELG